MKIGLGFMGSTHPKALQKIPGVEVAAVSSDDPRALSGDLSHIQGNIGGPGEKLDFSSLRKYSDAFAPASTRWWPRGCVSGRLMSPWRAGSAWLGNASLSGGGVFDLLIHDIDICLHLFGPPPPEAGIT